MVRVALCALVGGLMLVNLGGARAGGFPCDRFVKDEKGAWHVLQPLTIEGPGGRKIDFTPDETYTEGHEKLGLDMAKLLNSNCAKK